MRRCVVAALITIAGENNQIMSVRHTNGAKPEQVIAANQDDAGSAAQSGESRVSATNVPEKTAFRVLGTISLAHFLNDTTQSLILAIYPLLKSNFALSFVQLGLLTFVYQMSASVCQPLVGRYTDKNPKPYSLPVGMGFTLCGLLLMAFAPAYGWLLLAASMVGLGSSVFHPESSRVAHTAAGGRFGLAQSIFQVGGNAGTSAGPLLAAAIVVPLGQRSLALLAILPLAAIIFLLMISRWAAERQRRPKKAASITAQPLPRAAIVRSMLILFMLMFSKHFYMSSISNYFTFYLMHKFHVSTEVSQLYLFVFLFAVAVGTVAGGPIGDRIGRKYVIWVSILGTAPFSLALPYLNFFWTGVFAFIIGLILASAFSAILVFAQELLPGNVGTIAGLFFGLAFGLGGIGAAVLGKLADMRGIEFVYSLCSWLPLLGLLTVFLPDVRKLRQKATTS